MKINCLVILISSIVIACKVHNPEIKQIHAENYELRISPKQKAILILFPCFPCDIENTKTEAKFLNDIEHEGITTLLLNYNQKLFLADSDKKELANLLNEILDSNKIKNENIYIGGFSSGGNIAFLLSNYLLETKNKISPKALFVVDSPLDLEELYYGAIKDVKKNSHPDAVAEGNFIIELFEKEIGKPSEDIDRYKAMSPYLISCNSMINMRNLSKIKTRFYCEPDLDWQMKNRQRNYEDLNAYKMEIVHQALLTIGSTQTEFIKTTNRGIRANGERHPHSWNIVERESLIKWILD